MTRSASFRVTGNDAPDHVFAGAVTQLTALADDLAERGRDVYLNVTTDVAYDEHPERDALLALADKWRGQVIGPETCADELVRLLATLSL
jgi:hypothetical protein